MSRILVVSITSALLVAILLVQGIAQDTTDLSELNDEFSDATSISEWKVLSRQLIARGDIGRSRDGFLTIVPQQCGWYMDGMGTMIYKTVTGDFIAATYAVARNRNSPTEPPTQTYNSAGLIARDPASRPGRQNWVVVNVGRQQPNVGTETKNTVNSNSQLQLQGGANEGELRLCRIANTFYMLRKLKNESAWRRIGEVKRQDMPRTLQVGLMSNGYGGNPDLLAEYDYVRFAVPRNLDDCTRELKAVTD